MKTITVSDEDYEVLMNLSKELQVQDNDCQAFPYFWNAQSKKRVTNIHGEGSITEIYYDCESYSPEDFAEYIQECEDGVWEDFLENEGYEDDTKYSDDVERDWISYVKYYVSGADVWTLDLEYKSDHNFSLFKEDVKDYIEGNKHHLGGDPTTYARTIWRMHRMEKLVEAIYRINPQAKEDINHEASRFVYKD